MVRSQYEHSDPVIGAMYLSHPRRNAMLIFRTPAKDQFPMPVCPIPVIKTITRDITKLLSLFPLSRQLLPFP